MARRGVVALPALAGALLLVAGGAQAAETSDVRLVAAIDRHPLAEGTERRPVRLHPRELADLELQVTNTGPRPIEIRTVRLKGVVMALTFFAYDTSVSVLVAPGATETRTFQLDLVGLKGQAIGLIPSSVAVLDADREQLASQHMVADVRGSLWSVYGVFGIAVAILTAISLGGALVALAKHQLPENRWRRGLRFLTPGLGIGLFIVFTLSALRIFVPRPGRWVPILVVCGAAMFALGYLTPSPDDELDEDEQVALDEAEAAAPPRS